MQSTVRHLFTAERTGWTPPPFFSIEDQNIPANEKVPELHRYIAGGTLGFPLIKDKLFGFLSYLHTHVSDLDIGTSRTAVPFGLGADRSAAALAAVANNNWPCGGSDEPGCVTAVVAPNTPEI